MSADITSLPTIIQQLSMVSYAVSWAGAVPIGTISVEASNDYSLYPDSTVNNPGIWNPIPFVLNGTSVVTAIPVAGNSGNGFIDIDQHGAYALRLIYTATSGTGQLQVVINGKVA
jgi:hypothetical protein